MVRGRKSGTKITLDITDELPARAERHANDTARSLNAVVEDALGRVLRRRPVRGAYRLADPSVGDPLAADPLAGLPWPRLRAMIYGDSESG